MATMEMGTFNKLEEIETTLKQVSAVSTTAELLYCDADMEESVLYNDVLYWLFAQITNNVSDCAEALGEILHKKAKEKIEEAEGKKP